jgi:hypothetical protein
MTREEPDNMVRRFYTGGSNIAKQHDEHLENADKTTLAELDMFAVDSGIPDLAAQHDHYLYSIPK